MPINRKLPYKELVKSLMPITPMGKAMLVGIVVLFIDWALVDGRTLFGSEWLKRAFDLLSALSLIPLLWFLFKGAQWIAYHLLWRLRRRLIVTYLLIGALPILLLLLLIVLFGSVSIMHLAEKQFDQQVESSRGIAEAIARNLAQTDSTDLNSENVRRQLQSQSEAIGEIFPGLELKIINAGASSPVSSAAGSTGNSDQLPQQLPPQLPPQLPQWINHSEQLDQGFHGLVVETNQNGDHKIYVAHLVKIAGSQTAVLQLRYPINEAFCSNLSKAINLKVLPGRAVASVVMTSQGPSIDQGRLAAQGVSSPSPGFQLRKLPIVKPVTDWASGAKLESDVLLVDFTSLPPWKVWQYVQEFKSSSAIGNLLVWVTNILSLSFLMIALGAIVSAVFLTRSITGAVHHLYQGTKRLEAGDLQHEIPVYKRDQLGELGLSFNQMTRSIRELLRVSAEKQRLDQEMKIAAAVQSMLFPRSTPNTAKLDFAKGVCIPARAVSGDYYDFFEASEGLISIAVADVCGKGVSAALMMANLQANLRGQVEAHHKARGEALSFNRESAKTASDGFSTAEVSIRQIVQKVNRQIARAMIDASYITFFYAEFNEQSSTLKYTNAGHNPPILFRKNGIAEHLDCGGTVLGLFHDAEYEEAELTLASGDVLIAFTDGVIEALNPNEEEFGEDRLIHAVARAAHLSSNQIEQSVIKIVKAWVADAEQSDDLTLVIVKVN